MEQKDIEFYKSLQWEHSFITGHTCEHCGKVIMQPFCVCVSSDNAFYHFHRRCGKKVCKELGIKTFFEG